MHDGGDAHGGLDRLAADAVLAQHLLVRLDAHAAAVHRRNGERPELEIGLLDAGLGQRVHAQARRHRAVVVLADENLVRAAAEPLSGPLSLGVIPTVAPFLLPKVLARVRKTHPKLKLHLVEDLTARLLERLQAGELDLALVALPYRAPDLETLELGDDPFLLATPAGHPLAGHAHVDAGELQRAPLLLLEEGHCLRDHALSACHIAEGAPAGERLQATSLHTLTQMVAGGMGVTLLPQMAVDAGLAKGTGITTSPLDDPAAKRKIGFAWRPSSPRKAEFRKLAEYFRSALNGGTVKVHHEDVKSARK
jgi:LysR family transcriptional regulator, hydrogen peroxide-inducible genes activator